MKRKLIVGTCLLSLFLLSGCKPTSHATQQTSRPTTQVKKKPKPQKKLNAQTDLTTAEVKRRVIAWFADQSAFQIAEPEKLVFLDAATPTWQTVRGQTLLGGQVITTQNKRWAVEIHPDGTCKVFDPLNVNATPQTFDLFAVTQEQLAHVRKNVTKLNPAKPNQPNAQSLKTAVIINRITSYFAQTYALEPDSLTVTLTTKKSWIDVNGTDLFCATITSPAGTWQLEMTNDGAAYVQASSVRQIPGTLYHQQQGAPTFQLFQVTPIKPKSAGAVTT